jgi:hypothetical protein
MSIINCEARGSLPMFMQVLFSFSKAHAIDLHLLQPSPPTIAEFYFRLPTIITMPPKTHFGSLVFRRLESKLFWEVHVFYRGMSINVEV